MDIKLFIMVFGTVFVAEIADKTQFATLLFASDSEHSKLVVFAGSALALAVASGIAVFAGGWLGDWLNEKLMARIAGIAFVVIGVWTFVRA